MNGKKEGKSSEQNNSGQRAFGQHSGIRLSFLNVLLICVGLVIAVLMVISTYQTTGSVKEIVTVTDNYLNNQQTGGMLQGFTDDLEGLAREFVRNGAVGTAREYEGKLNVMNAQLEQYVPESSNSEAANQALLSAINAFRKRTDIEQQAMRLALDTENMPQASLAALPAFLKTELSAADQALSVSTRQSLAADRLDSEEYSRYGETVRTEVDDSHRLSSQEGKKQAEDTFSRVNGIVTEQMILVFLFIAVAFAALVLNRLLIITPMQKSVENLDHQEPIPVRGSYEMRHLAQAYNDVLKDNEEKTKALSYSATHDALTDMFNRAMFDKKYKEAQNEQVAVLVADVDHFKQYNDEFGHDIGDKVLQMAADALKRHFRAEDEIFRIGGDEFCIIMPGICQDRAESVRDRIIRINGELKQTDTQMPPVTLSAGIACWDRPNPKGSLFKDADRVLLELKKTRETCCAVYQG